MVVVLRETPGQYDVSIVWINWRAVRGDNVVTYIYILSLNGFDEGSIIHDKVNIGHSFVKW